jgi:elongation factor 1-gamma
LKDTATGEGLGQSVAIARFMCNTHPESGLYGSTAYEAAKIDEVVDGHYAALNLTAMKFLPAVFGYKPISKDEFTESSKKFKDHLKALDELIKDKEFFVGDKLSLADVYLVSSLNLIFAIFIDAGFKKAIPSLTKYYETTRTHAAFEHHLGKARFCNKAFAPQFTT